MAEFLGSPFFLKMWWDWLGTEEVPAATKCGPLMHCDCCMPYYSLAVLKVNTTHDHEDGTGRHPAAKRSSSSPTTTSKKAGILLLLAAIPARKISRPSSQAPTSNFRSRNDTLP